MIKLIVNSEEITQGEIVNYLKLTNQLKSVVQEWILTKEIDTIEISERESKETLEKYLSDNNIDLEELEKRLEKQKLDIYTFSKTLTRPKKIVNFREEKWGQRAKSLYLKNRDEYDKIKYHCLEFYGKSTMQEIYYRIKDKDETWESLAAQLNRGMANPTSVKGPIEVSKVDPILLNQMKQEGVGKITNPVRIENTYFIAEMIELDSEGFNEEMKQKILRSEFENYIKEKTNLYFEKLVLV